MWAWSSPIDELHTTIRSAASQLGDDHFKIRNAATWKLVRLAEGSGANRGAVVAYLKSITEIDDLETAVRAQRIIKTLTDPPKPAVPVDGFSGAT